MISVLIVNYHCAALTSRAVSSVLRECPSAEVIVVDNSESPEEAERLRQALSANCRLIIAERNLGFGRGCNLAYQAATQDVIFLLNPDALVLPKALQQLHHFLLQTPDAGAVSPISYWDQAQRWLLPPGQAVSPRTEYAMQKALADQKQGQIASYQYRQQACAALYTTAAVPQIMLSGAHLMLTRAVIDRLGGLFDEAIFMYYEDTDLCRRIEALGLTLYLLPTAQVVHEWQAAPSKMALSQASHRYYLTKHFADDYQQYKWRLAQPSEPRLPTATELGSCSQPPQWPVPEAWQDDWLLELSPHPLFIPAAYQRGQGSIATVSNEVWQCLGSGRYWARLSPFSATDLCESQLFQWDKPVVEQAAYSTLLQPLHDLSQQFAAQHTLSASQLSPQHQPLAERFGWMWDSDQACWKKQRQPRWSLAWAEQGKNEQAWASLFTAAFGYVMPEAQRQWKYAHANPFGVAVFREETMVAFYGGMPRAIRYFGQPSRAVQIGDVMVHPTERGVLTKNGPFQLAAATFLEYQIGYGKPHLLGFGFPESKALKLATRLGLYAQVDQMVALHWPPAARRWSPRVYARPVTPNEAGIVNTLWEDMAAAFQNSIIGVRDWAFIAHRYLAHPTVSYQLLLVRRRWRHQPLAVVILRDRPQEEAVELVDMIATPEHFSIAVGVARRFALRAGRKKLFAWLTQSHAPAVATATAATCHPLDIVIPTNIWSPGPDVTTLENHWWLMAGDTDFR